MKQPKKHTTTCDECGKEPAYYSSSIKKSLCRKHYIAARLRILGYAVVAASIAIVSIIIWI